MYPIAEKLPNEIERAAFVEALALIGTDQQDESGAIRKQDLAS